MVSDSHVFCRVEVDEKRFTTFGFVPRNKCIVMKSPDPYAFSSDSKTLAANTMREYHKRWLETFVPNIDIQNECLDLQDKGFYIKKRNGKKPELHWNIFLQNCQFTTCIHQFVSSPWQQNCISAMSHLFPELRKCTTLGFYNPNGCPVLLEQEISMRLPCSKHYSATQEYLIKLCENLIKYVKDQEIKINATSYKDCS